MLVTGVVPAQHDGSARFVQPRAPRVGEPVELRLATDPELGVTAVHARIVIDGEPHFVPGEASGTDADGRQWWRVRVVLANARSTYRFLLSTPRGTLALNALGLADRDLPDVDDFRLVAEPEVPQWVRGAVVYQVFPDRFARGSQGGSLDLVGGEVPQWAVPADWSTPVAANTPDGVRQLYGGTLWGLLEHLDHLVELGVTVVYLTPFFPANSNHRYDSTTFDHVDELLGGDEALLALTSAARERGIRVIGDLTLNHTGNRHEWFLRAQADPDSPEAGFYLFDDDPDGPGYACFWDVATLPKLDHRSAELRRRLYDGPDSVVAHYVRDLGLSGWRIDVAQSAGIHGETDLNLEVARLTRRTLAEVDPEAWLVAEIQHDPSPALQGGGWMGTMSYAGFTRPVWSWLGGVDVEAQWGVPVSFGRLDGCGMAAQMDEFRALLPWNARMSGLSLLDSHDVARFHTVAGVAAQRSAAALMMTLPGVPMVFAGDEVGVDGDGLEAARQPFPWDGPRDEELFAWYRQLVALRREHGCLQEGSFRWLHIGADAVVFERADEGERIVVQVARTEHEGWTSPWPLTGLVGSSDVAVGQRLPVTPGVGVWTAPSA